METTEKPLTGWKEIASFLGVHETTAKKMSGLPVWRIKPGGTVRSYRSEINKWLVGVARISDPR